MEKLLKMLRLEIISSFLLTLTLGGQLVPHSACGQIVRDTALIAAIGKSDTVWLNDYFKHNPKKIDKPISQNGTTALHLACGECDTTLVKLLLIQGANVNVVDNPPISEAPLHGVIHSLSFQSEAKMPSCLRTLELLLQQKNIRVNLKTFNGKTDWYWKNKSAFEILSQPILNDAQTLSYLITAREQAIVMFQRYFPKKYKPVETQIVQGDNEDNPAINNKIVLKTKPPSSSWTNDPDHNMFANAQKYAPFADPTYLFESSPTERATIDNTVKEFDLTWNVNVFFNRSDGSLNRIISRLMTTEGQSELSVLTLMREHSQIFTEAPDNYGELMASVIGAFNPYWVVQAGKFNTVYFITTSWYQSELIKMIGFDGHGSCWIYKFPKSDLPDGIRVAYEKEISSKHKKKK